MANEQNLKPFTSDQNREEAKKNGKKGGIASGEARRKKKSMAEAMKYYMDNAKPNAKQKKLMAANGIDPDEMDATMFLVQSIYNAACRGDMKAVDKLQELTGEEQDNLIAELKEVFAQIGGVV